MNISRSIPPRTLDGRGPEPPFAASARGRPGAGSPPAICAVLLVLSAGVVLGQPLEVRGRAVDESGAPVGGARVELQRLLPRYDNGSRIAAGVIRPEATGRVVTSGDGGYELRIPEPGMWQVEITAAGKIPVRRRLVPAVEDRELPPAVLAADGGAWIAVVDGEGETISGAQIWMRPVEDSPRFSRRRPPDWQERGRFALTDEAGNAYLSRRREQAIEVWAFGGGFLPSKAVRVDGDRGRVTLERGRPLEMRFLVASGEPAAQALVGVGELQWVQAKTDHDGRARLFLRPGEPLTFMLHLPSGQRESGTLEAAEEDFDPSGKAEEMTLPAPVILEGRVIDKATRDPAPAAWVWSAGDPGRVERVDRAGAYRLVEGASSYWQIGAAAPGYQPVTENLSAQAGGPRVRTLALSPAAAISGRVVDSSGAGVGGAEIVAWKAGRSSFDATTELRATSGTEGRFRMPGLALAADYELRVRAAGFAPALVAARAEAGAEIEVVLTVGRGVTGRVVSADGEPVAGALLVVTAGPARWLSMSGARPREPAGGKSGADGVFRLEGLAPEQSVLVARKEGFAPKQVPLFELTEDPPDAGVERMVELGDVVLVRGAAIRGIVRNEDEEPIGAVQIHIVGESRGSLTRGGAGYGDSSPTGWSTDEEGRFSIPGLVVGESVSLMFDHSGYLRHSVDGLVVGEDQPLEVVLERAARVSGRVENESRQPVPGVTVEARPLAGSRGLTGAFGDATRRDSAHTDATGGFLLERVSAGAVELRASGDGYVAGEVVELSIREGENREGVVLGVRRGAILEGTVRDQGRRPIEGAILQVSELEAMGSARFMRGSATAQSDADGGYRLEGLNSAVAELTLSVHHPEYLKAERKLDLDPGTQRLDVVLERGTFVTGTVLTDSGQPVAGAGVGLDGGRGVYFSGRDTTVTGPDGRFEISGVAPGVYRPFAMKEGFARSASPEPITVADGPIEALTLYLTRGGTIRGHVLGLEPDHLAGVAIFASDGTSQTATGVVDEEGEYRVLHVGFGNGTVSAMSQTTGQHVSEAFTLDTAGGEAWVDLEFRRAEGSTLSGTVRLDGEPWRNVQVMAQGGLDSQGGASTDRDGRFEIAGLRDGQHQLILFGGVAVAHTEVVEVRGATEVSIDITTVAVRGRVVSAGSGEPVARAEVTAEGGTPVWLHSMAARTETTGSGSFELVLPAHREITLRAKAPGRSEAALAIDTGSGAPIEGLELVLGAASELEVDVRLASGLTPTWVNAVVVDFAGRRVAAGGLAGLMQMPIRIGSVPAGDWTLLVAAESGALVALPVTVPGPPVSVVLPPESRISVDLSGLAGEMGSFRMRLLSPSGQPLTVPSYGQLLDAWPVLGVQTTIPSVPAGEWVVEITDDRGQVRRLPVTTAGGETASVRFE